jgi:hypothetical protein
VARRLAGAVTRALVVLGNVLAAVGCRHLHAAEQLQDRGLLLLEWSARVDPEAATVGRLQAKDAAPRGLRWLR